MAILTTVFGFILQFFSSQTIGAVTSFLTSKVNAATAQHGQDTTAATQIVVSQMQAEIAVRQAQASIASKHDKLVSFIGFTFAFHIFMTMLDGVFHLNWHIAKFPAPMDSWEGYIVLTICGAAPLTNVANALVTSIWKPR